jgi:hypothetical protein
MASVPPSRLPPHPLVSTEPEVRVRHACGQSFPDLVVLRGGRVPAFPEGVAFPRSSEEVRALFDYAREAGARIIPYGGVTSVVGHVNVEPGDAPILTVSLERLQQLHSLSEEDRLATFGAGVSGPRLEEALRTRSYTLGHFPQSFELSTLGSWIVTRSRGQQSLGYGRIENLFVGGRLESPAGPLVLPPSPPVPPGRTCGSSSSARRGAWASSPRPQCASRPCPSARTSTPSSSPTGSGPAPPCASQRELGWDDARWESEARAYLALWRAHYALPGSPRLPALANG